MNCQSKHVICLAFLRSGFIHRRDTAALCMICNRAANFPSASSSLTGSLGRYSQQTGKKSYGVAGLSKAQLRTGGSGADDATICRRRGLRADRPDSLDGWNGTAAAGRPCQPRACRIRGSEGARLHPHPRYRCFAPLPRQASCRPGRERAHLFTGPSGFCRDAKTGPATFRGGLWRIHCRGTQGLRH